MAALSANASNVCDSPYPQNKRLRYKHHVRRDRENVMAPMYNVLVASYRHVGLCAQQKLIGLVTLTAIQSCIVSVAVHHYVLTDEVAFMPALFPNTSIYSGKVRFDLVQFTYTHSLGCIYYSVVVLWH